MRRWGKNLNHTHHSLVLVLKNVTMDHHLPGERLGLKSSSDCFAASRTRKEHIMPVTNLEHWIVRGDCLELIWGNMEMEWVFINTGHTPFVHYTRLYRGEVCIMVDENLIVDPWFGAKIECPCCCRSCRAEVDKVARPPHLCGGDCFSRTIHTLDHDSENISRNYLDLVTTAAAAATATTVVIVAPTALPTATASWGG